MTAEKFPGYMSDEYLAEPANVLSLLAVHLQLANEELECAALMDRPHDKLAQLSRTLQRLAKVAEKASYQARRWVALSDAEREGVRMMLRRAQAGPAQGAAPQEEGN